MEKWQRINVIIIFGFCLLIVRAIMANDNIIKLPQPILRGEVFLEEVIFKRRSERTFSQKELSLNEISQLVWAAQGITAKKGYFNFRASPSAGALYPIEIYLLTKDGLFHYIPEGHKLEVLLKQDLRKTLADSSLGQDAVAQAPVDIVICAVYSRVTQRYGQRGIRYVHIEVGHVAQNIHLEAVALGLVSVPIGAFNDEQIKKLLDLPKDHEPLYIIPVGHPG